MSRPSGILAGAAVAAGLALLAGCAGGRVYENGINHMYLCAVRVARAEGYQVREQDFKPAKGTLIAALSMPDPRETPLHRGFFRRSGEVIWNIWEHGRLELWDDDVANRRIRTEDRVVVKFRSGTAPLSWLGVGSRRKTTVKVAADVSEYGREDWLIRRKKKGPEVRSRIHDQIAHCLVEPAAFRPGKRRRVGEKWIRAREPEEAEPVETPSAEAPPPAAPVEQARAPEAAREEAVRESAVAPEAESVAPAADPEAALNEGRKLYEGAKYREAIGLLAGVLAAEPDNAEAYGYLGAAHFQLGETGPAIAAYERYVELMPRDLRTREFLEELKQEQKVK